MPPGLGWDGSGGVESCVYTNMRMHHYYYVIFIIGRWPNKNID